MKTRLFLNPKLGVIAAASAVAATTWNEVQHRIVCAVDLQNSNLRIERLHDLKQDPRAIEAVERALCKEWGPFAALSFQDIAEMAQEAGTMVFVISDVLTGQREPKGCLQFTLADLGGDVRALSDVFPSFNDLTEIDQWRKARARGGDTAVLLQLTVFNEEDRGTGLGSLLRNAVLYMMPTRVRHALTTTPMDVVLDGGTVDFMDSSTWTPAMKFHARGGAAPVALLLSYKVPSAASAIRHSADVVIMKYSREVTGEWPTERPSMRVRSRGPLQEALDGAIASMSSLCGRRIRALTGAETSDKLGRGS